MHESPLTSKQQLHDPCCKREQYLSLLAGSLYCHATSSWHDYADGHHKCCWLQDWEIVPSALDLDPRLQHLLDRHNMSSEETVLPDRPEMQEKGNPPSSLPGDSNIT